MTAKDAHWDFSDFSFSFIYFLDIEKTFSLIYLISVIIDHYFDTNLQPLHHAARGEHVDIVRLLLASGASPAISNTYGKVSI